MQRGSSGVAALVLGVVVLGATPAEPRSLQDTLNELTTFAAFTALVVFLFAIAGAALGRFLVDRKAPPAPHHGTSAGDDRADTDVFAAVRPDDGRGETAHSETRRQEES